MNKITIPYLSSLTWETNFIKDMLLFSTTDENFEYILVQNKKKGKTFQVLLKLTNLITKVSIIDINIKLVNIWNILVKDVLHQETEMKELIDL